MSCAARLLQSSNLFMSAHMNMAMHVPHADIRFTSKVPLILAETSFARLGTDQS